MFDILAPTKFDPIRSKLVAADYANLLLTKEDLRQQSSDIYANEAIMSDTLDYVSVQLSCPQKATEGIFSDVYEFIRMCIRNVIEFIGKVIKFFLNLFKSVTDSNARSKKDTDTKYDQLVTLLSAMDETQKRKTLELFRTRHIAHMCEYQKFIDICAAYQFIAINLDTQLEALVARPADVMPDTKLPDDYNYLDWLGSELITSFTRIGITFNENNEMQYQSPYAQLPDIEAGALGFTEFKQIAVLNETYVQQVFNNLGKIRKYISRLETAKSRLKDEMYAISRSKTINKQQYINLTLYLTKNIAIFTKITNAMVDFDRLTEYRRRSVIQVAKNAAIDSRANRTV